MQTPLSSFLRQLRRKRGLSQLQVAQAAGLGSVTLSRWENGARQPHKTNLEALLRALGATTQERQHALSLLPTPRSRPHGLIVLTQSRSEIGVLPHAGTFLRTLRLRRGYSQEEAARRADVTERTLRRWENGEITPSSAQIQLLCYILGAHPEEMLALTSDSFALGSSSSFSHTISPYDLKLQVYGLYYNLPERPTNALRDLEFLQLISQAWPLALRSEGGREVLSQIYSYYAASLATAERWMESGYYAERALELLPTGARVDGIRVMAAIALARSRVSRGNRPAPGRGLEMLRDWQDVNSHPRYKSWILSDMAEYLAMSGDAQSGLPLAQRASKLATECENLNDLNHRELDEAQTLVWAGKPAQALPLVERNKHWLPEESQLVEIEALLGLAARDKAQEKLEEVWERIEIPTKEHLRPQAQRLDEQIHKG